MVSGTNAEDCELAESLRREDPGQFHTLVRMHLSFVLDLNTDECDGVVEKTGKLRSLKWSFTPFGKRLKPPVRNTVEGVPLNENIIYHMSQLIEWLGKEQNVIQEGIFRRSGKLTRQQELRNLLTNGSPLHLDDGQFSVHDCASVLKNFLAQLPEPLLTDAHYPAHCQIAELCSNNGEVPEEERLLKSLQLILLLLPLENLLLLRNLLGLLHLTANHAHKNKMSADNLATLFTPHLLCPRKLSPEALHSNSQTMSRVVSFMIRQGPALFHVPSQLATDIRAYWTSQEKRKLMPKKDLNESICDGLAAKTVFTFVDREKTAEASAVNPTEAALAQLYAHIQSLPESSKKRKLIKQFNKENGQGTPQLVTSVVAHNSRLSRSRQRNINSQGLKARPRSRSLGDSIKKHIPVFSRGTKDIKKNGDETPKPTLNSPRNSPASKVKLFFQRNITNEDQDFSPQSLKETKISLPCDTNAGGSSESSRCRGMSNSVEDADGSLADDERLVLSLKRPASVTDTNAHSVDVEESCSSSKSPCRDPDNTFSVPLPPSVGVVASPEAKHLPGTLRAESWPVSTASTACSSGNDSPTNNLLTTPRNVLAWMTSTPAYAHAVCQMDSDSFNNCLLTPSNANGNNSMSPITRSTQKMSKAMQENMMTPRSRKPVIVLSSSNLSQLAPSSGWGRSASGELRRDATSRATLLSEAGASLTRKFTLKEESFIETVHETSFDADKFDSVRIPIEKMLAKEMKKDFADLHKRSSDEVNGSLNYYSCSSEESASSGTGLSRSVLSSSPVDLSFSSRTGDFDTSSERDLKFVMSNENMSESLLFCLDGNDPSCLNDDDDSCKEIIKRARSLHDTSASDSSGVAVEPMDNSNTSIEFGSFHKESRTPVSKDMKSKYSSDSVISDFSADGIVDDVQNVATESSL